jgi:hypothetical protein
VSLRASVLLAIANIATTSGAIAAPAWSVESSEIAYLFYGEPGKPLLTITCGEQEGETGKDETRIEVDVDRGTKPGKGKVELVVEHKGGKAKIPLKADLCSAQEPCAKGNDGEVYRYETSVPGKALALDIAEKGKAVSLDAPGAKIAALADEASFQKFAGFCRNW